MVQGRWRPAAKRVEKGSCVKVGRRGRSQRGRGKKREVTGGGQREGWPGSWVRKFEIPVHGCGGTREKKVQRAGDRGWRRVAIFAEWVTVEGAPLEKLF